MSVLSEAADTEWQGEIQNVSMGGAGLLLRGDGLVQGKVCVRFQPENEEGIACSGRVVWCVEQKETDGTRTFLAGVEFIHPMSSTAASFVDGLGDVGDD